MPGADKLRRRGRARPEGEALAELKPKALEPEVLPATIEEDDDKADAVARLLGEAVPSPLRDRLRRHWGRMRWALLAIAAVGLLAQIVLWVNYRAMHVTSRNAVVRGNLAEIGSRITGIVTKVEVDVGDRVTAGQVLVRLADRHLVAEVEEARAAVRGLARAVEVERLAIENQRSQTLQEEREAKARVAAADAQTKAAKVRAEDARREQELRESLFSRDGVVSAEDVRESASRRRTAEAFLEEAQANAIVAESSRRKGLLASDALTIRDKKVDVLEADLLRAQARLARAEADLEGASIRAPQDGAIVRRIIQPGGSVENGRPIISMWLGGDVWVEAWIDEDDIGSVSLNSEASVTFHSYPGREFAGVVDKIGLATDFEMPENAVPQPKSVRMRGSPVVGVRIRLSDPPPDLMPGLSAVVAIRKKE
jgi:membrane fusion protein, multidrug efflux system